MNVFEKYALEWIMAIGAFFAGATLCFVMTNIVWLSVMAGFILSIIVTLLNLIYGFE